MRDEAGHSGGGAGRGGGEDVAAFFFSRLKNENEESSTGRVGLLQSNRAAVSVRRFHSFSVVLVRLGAATEASGLPPCSPLELLVIYYKATIL